METGKLAFRPFEMIVIYSDASRCDKPVQMFDFFDSVQNVIFDGFG